MLARWGYNVLAGIKLRSHESSNYNPALGNGICHTLVQRSSSTAGPPCVSKVLVFKIDRLSTNVQIVHVCFRM